VRGQLRARKTSRRDRDRARTDCFATGDIVRRIADDIDVGRGEIYRVFFARPALGEGPERVAIVMIVSERAQLEIFPDAVMRELELRASLQVAGEKRKNVLGPGLQSEQQFLHSRE